MEEEFMTKEVFQEEEIQPLNKKVLKKEISRTGWGLIFYMLINLIIVSVDLVYQITILSRENGAVAPTEEQILALSESAAGMIVGVLVGVLFLWLFMGKRADTKEMFSSNRSMSVKALSGIVSVFMFVQIIFSGLTGLMEAGLNLFGYSAMESIEAASGASNTISMFLYVSFIGPVVEELVYRGFVMQPLKKYGNVFAIVVSAFLFGVMHGNVVQIPFAFFVGLVLGYVAQEYSLKWAMVVHIINNFVFVELVGLIGKFFGEIAEIVISGVLIWGLAVVGAVILWRKRKDVIDYIKEHKTDKSLYFAVFTSVSIVIFTLGCIMVAITAIMKVTL